MFSRLPSSSVFASLFAVALTVACSSGSGSSSGGSSSVECTSSAQCNNGSVCESGKCVAGGSTGGSSTGGSSTGGSSTGGSAGSCGLPGDTCSSNGQCCTSGANIGTEGQLCISDDNSCHAACTSNTECKSGCCAMVNGSSLGVCAAASNCGTGGSSGAPPGGACTKPADCSQSNSNAPYGETCLSDDYVCHALCTSSSQCTSKCCIKLQTGTYGACGTYASNLTCL